MTEETFVRELERRADHVHGAPLSFADVRAKARSIQRRRRTAAAGAVAAVVAAAIVVPTMLAGGPGRTSPDPAPPSPTITPTTPPTTPSPAPPSPAPGTPGASVLHDGILTLPDGATVTLDVDTADVQQLGVLTDGRIVVAGTRPYGVQVYGPDGRLESQHEVASNAITMSADDTLVTWIDETFRVVVLESGVAVPTTFDSGIPMPGESAGSLDAVLGSDCAAGGCTVLGGDYSTTTTEVTLTGNRDLETSEPLQVAAVSPHGEQWAVTFPADEGEQFGCSGLYDPAAGDVVARSCDTTLWSYSPDGAHLTGARGDNRMWGSVEVLDEDLDVVLSYAPDAGQVVKDWGWADAEHLLVVVVGLEGNNPDWSLLRVPIDGGEPEVVEGPVPGPNAEMPPVFLVSD
jgi:hypothetical protein